MSGLCSPLISQAHIDKKATPPPNFLFPKNP